MAGSFPLGLDVCNGQSVGAVTASSVGTTITASGTANTKGSYTQLIASTAADCSFVVVFARDSTSAATLLDIAIGGSGSEQVVIPNISLGAVQSSINFACPLHIPSGTRIAARSQSATSSATCLVNMQCYDGSFVMMEGVAGYDDIGTVSGTSTGTSITVSATANTLGSYIQLVASTAKDYMGVFGMNNIASAAQSILMNVAIGASGSEQNIIPNISFRASSSSAGLSIPFVPILIPSGTRIAANAQNSATSGSSPVLQLYGAYQ